MQEAGLTYEEYACIRGNGGWICGLKIGIHIYHRLLRKCRSKKARSLALLHEEGSKLFMLQKIKKLAHKQMLKKRALSRLLG